MNFCKNPACVNFGIPAKENIKGMVLPAAPGTLTGRRHRDNYTIGKSRKSGRIVVRMVCNDCKASLPIKSNKGVNEELLRIMSYLRPPKSPACRNKKCKSYGLPLADFKWLYTFHGTSNGKSERYRCKTCGATFSIKTTTAKPQSTSHKNPMLFKLLVNKMPFQRICEVLEMDMHTLYSKVDFLHRQCQAFAASYERNLPELKKARMYISLDRQDYVVNWAVTNDKRNIILHALGSADNHSGFVFGMHLNFDPAFRSSDVEENARLCKDPEVLPPFRRFARFWLECDYQESKALAKGAKKEGRSRKLKETVADSYAEAQAREDIEAYEEMSSVVQLPNNGLQIHAEYTMYGHMAFLHKLLPKVSNVRFFIERESGLRAACLAAFADEVKDGRCDAFFVSINKELNIHDRQRLVQLGKRDLEEFRCRKGHWEGISETGLRQLLIEEMLENGILHSIGNYKDLWLDYPAPAMNEPEKMVSWQTDMKNRRYSSFHLAKLYSKASLHGIDRFFMQLRRRISLLERPIKTSSATGRTWYGYSPYKPENIAKVIEIFRVFYNYVKVGDDGKTPAMRLGLARGPAKVEDIIYYLPR
ncbi:MAG: hypothetical protein CXR31_08830 [Geobacter sp.]|nr:MAG: hypothetical protein CXR31_08830 [Geobacter sp.]